MSSLHRTDALRLKQRQKVLETLIHDLTEELGEVNRKLLAANFPARPRLDRKFFTEIIRPILQEAGPGGLRAKDLDRRITERGLRVDYNNLRLFLSRAARHGQLRQIERSAGPNSWALNTFADSMAETPNVKGGAQP